MTDRRASCSGRSSWQATGTASWSVFAPEALKTVYRATDGNAGQAVDPSRPTYLRWLLESRIILKPSVSTDEVDFLKQHL
ncbi:MAG: hypothetical protein NVS3B5_23300 [Sphingomicrobium sp.]